MKGNIVGKDVITKSKQDNSAIVASSDYDWIVIDGLKSEIYGKPNLILNGEIVDIASLNSFIL